MSEQEITIGLVDDDPFALQALAAILNSTPNCAVSWATSDPEQARESCHRDPVDLVLLDYLLGEITGDVICKQITQQNPQQKVVIISSLEVADVARAALLAGARGFLNKADVLKDLPSFLSVIMQDSVVVSHAVVQGLFQSIPAPSQIALSQREQAVSELILQGMSNREIAEKMSYSLSTVKETVTVLLEKTHTSSRTAAVAVLVQDGAVSYPKTLP